MQLRRIRYWRAALPVVATLVPLSGAGTLPEMVVANDAHPRVICTSAGLDAMRAQKTPDSSNIVQRVRALSLVELTQRDVLKEAGFQAAGLIAAGLIAGDETDIAKGRDALRRKIAEFPLDARLSLMEKSCRIMGASMAFDLGYASWDEEFRGSMGKKLIVKARDMVAPFVGKGHADDVLCAVAYCSAGVCAMSLLGESHADAEARDLLSRSDEGIRAYLKSSLTANGVDVHGEGLKQVLFASGLLPYMHAWRNTFGAWPDFRPVVLAGMKAVAYQTVAGCGTFRFENAGSAIDRSGLCAMGMALADDDESRMAMQWLYRESVEDGGYDVTRPVHGLYMMMNDVKAMEAIRRTDSEIALPFLFRDDASGLVSFRNTWGRGDAIGLAVTLHAGVSGKGDKNAGDFRMYGLGGRWATLFGAHADKYGPAEGRILNTAGFIHEKVSAFESGGTSMDVEGRYTTIETAGKTMLLAIERKGKVTMKRTTKDPQSKKISVETAASGDCTLIRSVAADYTGLCGAPGLFVFVDRITGPDGVPTAWAMHTDAAFKLVEEGRAEVRKKEAEKLKSLDEQVAAGTVKFSEKQQKLAEISREIGALMDEATKRTPYDQRCVLRKPEDDGTTLAMTIAAGPNPRKWVVAPMGRLWNEAIIQGVRECMVVMTLQKGDGPDVKVEGEGLGAKVTVGKRTITFDGQKIVLGE